MFDSVTVQPRGLIRAARLRRAGGPTHIVIDVDGCLTDGTIYLDRRGSKALKRFGPDDASAVKDARERGITVLLCSADERGYTISQHRADQLGVRIRLVKEFDRSIWLSSFATPSRTIYIGDGYHDAACFKSVGLGIAPADAFPSTRRAADLVTSCPGGRRAVAQAIDFVLRRMT